MLKWLLVSILIGACGCTGPEYRIHEARDDARAIKTLSGPASGTDLLWHGSSRLALELKRLNAFSDELTDIAREMTALHRAVSGKKIAFYSTDEHDRLESMLFRYLICREALWDVASYYGERQKLFTRASDQVKGFIIAYSAALKVNYTDTKMVVTFLDEPEIVTKLNAAYPRCRVPAGCFDRIFHSVTSVDHLEAMEAAWELFKGEADDPKSSLCRVARDDEEYGALVDAIKIQRLYAKAQTDRLLDMTSVLFPSMENRLRQSKVAEIAANTKAAFETGLGACGSLLGSMTMKLIRSPLATYVQWGHGDLKSMFALAQPGDIILTMREGYLSNIVIPGEFKHGITYVGSIADRHAAGLTRSALTALPPPQQRAALRYLSRSRSDSGNTADCIEAISQGVVMTSTARLRQLAVNRVLILRPRLTPAERTAQLATVFGRMENPYDFKFNFADDRRLCCTELIYRSLQGRGSIAFNLIRRMGMPTLSADDIIRTFFDTHDAGSPMLQFVALAEETPGAPDHAGRVLTGSMGLDRLRVIMNIPAPRADSATARLAPAPACYATAGPPRMQLAKTRPTLWSGQIGLPRRFTLSDMNRRLSCSIPSQSLF